MNKINRKLLLFFGLLIAFSSLLTLTACKKKYKISFIVDGNVQEVVEVKKGESVTKITDPSKENYDFIGWFEGANEFDFETKITDNLVLIAKFERTKYSVKFKVDDVIQEEMKVEKGTIISEIDNPVKEDFNFIGWFNGDEKFDFDTPIESNTILEAKFQQTKYRVTFMVDGKVEEIVKVDVGSKVSKITNPKKPNYNFIGWYYNGNSFNFNKPVESDCVLEAKFIINIESIKINCNSLEVIAGETLQLNAVVFPNFAPQTVLWSVKNIESAEATIDSNGLLTAIKPGKVYVYANSTEDEYAQGYIEINILHPLIDEDIYDAFNIMTGFGSNAATDIEINYHTHNIKSYVEFTLASDLNFANFSTQVPQNGYYFTNGSEEVLIQFEPRNVMRVSLTGLEPDTEYIYRINKGNNTYSDVYKFKTAKNDGSKTSFLAFADIHYWAKFNEETGEYESHGSEISEEIVQKALDMNPNIGFIATAGDIVDQGGSVHTWEQFFLHSKSLKFLPRVSVAGNHEYYYNNTGQTDYKYQKAHNATPYNGPSSHIGASGYTLYNDVLFITFDNEKSVGIDIQYAWLENVLQTVEAKYTIIMMHSPIYYPAQGPNATDHNDRLMGILEKYCVDLAIAGHYHGDNWTPDFYENEHSTDPGLGVNYITMSFGGVKSMSDGNPPTGYIFDIEDGVINIQRIDNSGRIISTRSITTKKHKDYTIDTKENLIDSIQECEYDKANHKVTIRFSNNFYGNVEKLEVTEELRNEINKTIYFPTSSYNKVVISDIKDNHDYHFILKITFTDGTTETVKRTLNNGPDIQLKVSKQTSNSVTLNFIGDDELMFFIDSYKVYVNGVEHSIIPYSSNGNPITSYTIEGLNASTHYTIELRAKNTRKETIMYIITIETDTL